MCKNLTITAAAGNLPVVNSVDFAYDRDCSSASTIIEVCTKDESELAGQYIAIDANITFPDTLTHNYIISFEADGVTRTIIGSMAMPVGIWEGCIRQTTFLYNSYTNLTGLRMAFTS